MCEICKSNACCRSFHSLESQERFDRKQKMSDDVDELRDKVLDLEEENKLLLEKVQNLTASSIIDKILLEKYEKQNK